MINVCWRCYHNLLNRLLIQFTARLFIMHLKASYWVSIFMPSAIICTKAWLKIDDFEIFQERYIVWKYVLQSIMTHTTTSQIILVRVPAMLTLRMCIWMTTSLLNLQILCISVIWRHQWIEKNLSGLNSFNGFAIKIKLLKQYYCL